MRARTRRLRSLCCVIVMSPLGTPRRAPQQYAMVTQRTTMEIRESAPLCLTGDPAGANPSEVGRGSAPPSRCEIREPASRPVAGRPAVPTHSRQACRLRQRPGESGGHAVLGGPLIEAISGGHMAGQERNMEGDANQRRRAAKAAREAGMAPSEAGVTLGASKQRREAKGNASHQEKMETKGRGKQAGGKSGKPRP